MESQQQLELAKPGIVDLPVTVEKLKEKADQFKELKDKLLTANDYADINGRKYIKKSGIFQFALAFNLTTEIIKEEKEIDEKNPTWYAYHFTVRCTAPNGRTTEKAGSCSNDEKGKEDKPLHTTVHKVRSMAETRATNRAISAMVGSAEVSAEEIHGMNGVTKLENKPNNKELCQCPFDQIKNVQGKCSQCNKPLSVAQLKVIEEMQNHS